MRESQLLCLLEKHRTLRSPYSDRVKKGSFTSKPTTIYRIITIALFLISSLLASAQESVDTLSSATDTTAPARVEEAPVLVSGVRSMRPAANLSTEPLDMGQSLLQQIWGRHPYFLLTGKAELRSSREKQFQGKELLFYAIVALLLLFAMIRNAFGKYLSDIFRVFFRTTLKQRQIRDQLMQTPLPSLMFNFFFVASTGFYLSFLLYDYFEYRPVDSFWWMYLYVVLALTAIYFVKFVVLKLAGWLFNVRQAADSYIFVVFIINKVLGVFLLPFVVVQAFASEPLYSISLILSWAGIAALFLYRVYLGMSAARNEVKFNLFHFLLFVAAFEVAPLLLIYRLLIFRF